MGLPKNPGVRPIGIGEIYRRICAEAFLQTVKDDAMEAAGPLQTCAGLPSEIEAAVHAMDDLYEEEETECILLVDADNAFNRLNRSVVLKNINITCPIMAQYLQNIYGGPSKMYIGDTYILSQEGATQGDVIAMLMYGLGTTPLIYGNPTATKPVWYADDGGGEGQSWT